MKKICRILSSVILAISMLTGAVIVSAADVAFTDVFTGYDDKTLTASVSGVLGNGAGVAVDVLVMYPDAAGMKDDIKHMDSVLTGDNGKFEFSFSMNDSLDKEGWYNVVLNNPQAKSNKEIKFYFAHSNKRNAALKAIQSAVNSGKISEVATAVSQNSKELQLGENSEHNYNNESIWGGSYSLIINSAAEDSTRISSIIKFVQLFNTAVLIDNINNAKNTETAGGFINDIIINGNAGTPNQNGNITEKAMYAYQTDLGEDGQTLADAMLINQNISSLNDYCNKFSNAVFVSGVNAIADWKTMQTFINKYHSEFAITDSHLAALNKNAADSFKKLIRKPGQSFKTIPEIKAALPAEASLSGGNPSQNGGGSSGGGGSSSGTHVFTPSVSVEGSGQSAPINQFSDVIYGNWDYQPITVLTRRGIINGYGDGTFRGENNITRAEFVKVIVAALGLNLEQTTSVFSDVSENDWCNPYIAAAYNAGIVNGISDNVFGGDRLITRQDAVTIAYRAFNESLEVYNTESESAFEDKDQIAEYAKKPISVLCNSGIITGVGDNMFAPNSSATRSACAKIVYGLLGLKEEMK